MTGFLFWLWSMLCHDPSHTQANTSCPLIHMPVYTTMDGDGGDGGDGGEGGGGGETIPIPPTPPPPPPKP